MSPVERVRDEGVESDTAPSVSLTRTGTIVGTLAYMPLEQLEGQPVDARSDQFSFCVSLFEAVYSQRPFAGTSAPRLMVALYEGKVEPVPRGTRVPARLHPRAAAWPVPDAGGSLAVDGAAAGGAPSAGGTSPPQVAMVCVGAGLVAIGAGLWQLARSESPCQGARAALAGVWDDAQRRDVEAAILATELPHAADTWERVRTRIDEVASTWVARHQDVCEATSVRKEQSTEVMDLRMACLSTRRIELRETVRVLSEANDTTVNRAVGMGGRPAGAVPLR